MIKDFKRWFMATFFYTMKISIFPFFLALSLLSLSVSAQSEQVINVMFYNVENLFDTIDNAQTADEDFIPGGKLEYNSFRYQEKLQHLAIVLDSSFNGHRPSVVGLCEVENRNVVEELRNHTTLIKGHEIVHIDSPDGRGIDNALLFDSSIFKLGQFGLRKIDLGSEERHTRGILWVVLQEKETLQPMIFLVNHWPSRYGGAEESEWKRLKAAETSVLLIDSLLTLYPNGGLIFMGDLNDHPDNKSVMMLEACGDGNPCMVNMHKQYMGSHEGSHAYRGEWGILDQILVNQIFLDGTSAWNADSSSAAFVKKSWMLYHSDKDDKYFPSRSFGGTKYFGGYSDHLPATLTLKRNR
jgi:hypothetical protein